MNFQPCSGDHFLFTCSLPGPVDNGTTCNLYIGEESHPVITTTWKKRASATKQWFCEFPVRTDDLLRHLHFIQQKGASCDYSLGSEPNTFSPRSDGYSLTGESEETIYVMPITHLLSLLDHRKSNKHHVSPHMSQYYI